MKKYLILALCLLATQAFAVGNDSFIQRQTFAAGTSGTFTPNASTNSIVVTMCGGGGGSAGVIAANSTHASLGGAGGGAGCLIKWINTRSLFNGATYAVGQAGTAGTSGGGSGGLGGTSTFTLTNSTVLTANGGPGGGCYCNGSPPLVVGANIGGTATGGDLNFPGGGTGGGGISTAPELAQVGGNSLLGIAPGAVRCISQATAGNTGGGYGAGASGSCAINTASNAAGAAGAPGVIFVDEYR